MQIQIAIVPHLIEPRRGLPNHILGACGAIAEFEGVVRAEENGAAIEALEYEAYEPMARRVMHQIVTELGREQPCLYVRVTHRVGVVPVGEAAIQILVAARHRGPAFAMLAGFMDRLKTEAPIWKRRAIAAGAASSRQPA